MSQTRFPPVPQGSPLSRKVEILGLLAGSSLIILSGTIAAHGTRAQNSEASLSMKSSQIISRYLRPPSCPAPPWHGANKVIPMLQSINPVWQLLSCRNYFSLQATMRCQLLEHSQQTNALQFRRDDFRNLKGLSMENLNERSRYRYPRHVYEDILQQHGHTLQTDYEY
jgi:hypothetical protein